MNNKGFLIFCLGAATGSIITTFVLRRKMEEKLQEEVKSIYEVLSRNKKGNTPKKTEDVEVKEGNYGKIIEVYKTKNIPVEHETCSIDDPDSCIHPMDSEEEEEIEVFDAPPYGRTPPYLIDDDQFSDDCEYHDKITLSYYSDGVLIDEEEEAIVDVDQTIGFDNLKKFDDPEIDVIYVRNCNISIDYEILRLETSYAELINGGDVDGNKS
jgi:hypothetical protein